MKKTCLYLLTLALLLGLCGCSLNPFAGSTTAEQLPTETVPATTAAPSSLETRPVPTEAPLTPALTYEEYLRAPLDQEVTVEAWIQFASQKVNEAGQLTVSLFLQDEEGFFLLAFVAHESFAGVVVLDAVEHAPW